MPLWSSEAGYGSETRFLHWAVVLLFAPRFTGGLVMTRLGQVLRRTRSTTATRRSG
jgi:cytochrome b561